MMIKKYVVISLFLHVITTSIQENECKVLKEYTIRPICQDLRIYIPLKNNQ